MNAVISPFGGCHPLIADSAFLAPGCVVIGDVTIGETASVWFGAVLRGDHPEHGIRIGARANIQDNAVVHTSERGPTVVSADVTVGHGAILESCHIGDRAVIGMGAIVLHRAQVGEGCVVAAGAVVREGMIIPPNRLVVGVPATVRDLGPGAASWTRHSASHYVSLSRKYRAMMAT